MTSRERVLTTLSHTEPDYFPFEIGATNVTGIALKAYQNYAQFKGLEEDIFPTMDIIQQLAQPSEQFLSLFATDVRGVMPLYYANYPLPEGSAQWQKTHQNNGDELIYTDEWGLEFVFRPQTDLYYSLKSPILRGDDCTLKDIENLKFPQPDAKWRFAHIAEEIARYRAMDKIVVCKTLNSGFLETGSKIRGMDHFLMDMLLNEAAFEALIERIFRFKYSYWEKVLDLFGPSLDVVVEADDYGTQNQLLFNTDLFKRFFKPRWAALFEMIKKRCPHIHIFFHSCGAVRDLIPEFINMGVDILNPVQFTAQGMDLYELKKTFGEDIVLWGGGVDTQNILPNGTPQEIFDHVCHNIDILAPGGGWVFAPVHNIQSDVSPERLEAVRCALQHYRVEK